MGEYMIELRHLDAASMALGFGGETLNGAVSLVRRAGGGRVAPSLAPAAQAASPVRMADTSNSRATFSLTSMPPAPRAAFQLMPQSFSPASSASSAPA